MVIVLSADDIKNRRTFKVQKLQPNKLYLWHATQFEWVPLWTMKSGFLLINLNFI